MTRANLLPRISAALADRYRIERELGVGGMATVFLAQDLKHQRPVAVKVLDPELAATIGLERFLREIRITAALQHPNILTLIDSGEADELLFYVMPFAEGESLRDRLTRAQGALPEADAIRIFRDTMDALAYAHRHHVVHRDVKPENIMISGRHALVLDFGVAKAVQIARDGSDDPGLIARVSRDSLTSVGTSLGTPSYMAPEQAAGDPTVDHRADIYAAGLVAYEMLCGEPPFRGKQHEVLIAQVMNAPRPLRERAREVSLELTELVMLCLNKAPEQRPQSADEVLEELDSIERPTGPATTRVSQKTRRRSRRRRAFELFVGTLVIAALVFFAVRLMTGA